MKLAYQPDFSGKVAVVTGGAGVLCSMFAQALSLCGAKVAVLDLAGDKAEALAAELRGRGGEAIGVAVNVLETESVQAAHRQDFA